MAASTPKVSVLLPSLNARKFLEPRVDSLRRQTFADWEAIVLDSHSTDGTWEFFQSVAETDPRFRLHQVPREGVYDALNRGLELARGEFVYIATADDTMAPDFFARMIEALGRCPNAGVAVCDCLFINRDGHELRAEDMSPRLSRRQIRNLLRSGTVRTSLPDVSQPRINYRPPPHDCLLHFTGRSVYFSLTQLLIRTESAKATGLFETDVGSAADFGWLVRLTSLTGTVHLPEQLATWRFHGDQLSLQRDNARLTAMSKMCQDILPAIRERYPGLLTDEDCERLLLPFRKALARTVIGRVRYWLRSVGRSAPTVAMLRHKELAPRDLEAVS
jgi:glycosyltransferase involved in cell wall biosynthesis